MYVKRAVHANTGLERITPATSRFPAIRSEEGGGIKPTRESANKTRPGGSLPWGHTLSPTEGVPGGA
eukprot:1522926-Prymnesium_polylepis.1